MNRRPLLALAALFVLSACGLDLGSAAQPGGDGASSTARLTIADADVSQPAMGVSDALGISANLPVRVSGSLFVDAQDRVLLCSAIAESFPPQCGGERIEVLGLDLSSIALETAEGVRWAEAVELVGTVGP